MSTYEKFTGQGRPRVTKGLSTQEDDAAIICVFAHAIKWPPCDAVSDMQTGSVEEILEAVAVVVFAGD